jgi:hypothetical protein
MRKKTKTSLLVASVILLASTLMAFAAVEIGELLADWPRTNDN